MTKKILLIASVMFILGLAAWAGFQAEAKTAVDPVCGMTVTKAGAKWTFDYKGTTYYFCSEGCKTSFAKEPEKYLAKQAEKAEQMKMSGGMMGGQMQGQMQGHMQGGMMGGMMGGQGQGQMQGHMQGGMMGGMMGGQMQCPMQGLMMRHMMGRPMGMMPGMRGRMAMRPGFAGGLPLGLGPLMLQGFDKKVENIKDGVVITLTSKDPEAVKRIQERVVQMLEREKMMQERLTKMKEAQAAAAKKAGEAGGDCANCPMKKK